MITNATLHIEGFRVKGIIRYVYKTKYNPGDFNPEVKIEFKHFA